MRYCTLDDLLLLIQAKTLAQLTNDTAPATEPNLRVIERIVEGVEEVIDGGLRSRYDIPFKAVPTVVRDITVKIARHEIYTRRPEGKDDLPPAVVRGYKDAMAMLDAIKSGKMTIGIAATQAAQPEPGKMRMRARKRVFGDSVLDKFA